MQSVIEDAIATIVAAGKPAGILTFDQALNRHYLTLGAKFVAVGADIAEYAAALDVLARPTVGAGARSDRPVTDPRAPDGIRTRTCDDFKSSASAGWATGAPPPYSLGWHPPGPRALGANAQVTGPSAVEERGCDPACRPGTQGAAATRVPVWQRQIPHLSGTIST